MQSQEQQRSTNFWKPAAILSFLLAMANIYGPAKEIYLGLWGVAYEQITLKLAANRQHVLSERNAACFVAMERVKIEVNSNLSITYGACSNMDVNIGVYPKNLRAYEHWLEPNRDDEKKGYQEITSALLSRPREGAPSQPARTVLKTVCQGSHDERRETLDRITNDAGQCYYERVNTLSGTIEVREIVPCDSQCEVVSKTFNLK